MDTVKWLWAGLVAVVLAVLAFVVGKKTPHVLAAKLRANKAQQDRLRSQLRDAEAAQRQADAEQAAATASTKASAARDKLKRLSTEAGDITGELRAVRGEDDDAFADAFNRRGGPARHASNG